MWNRWKGERGLKVKVIGCQLFWRVNVAATYYFSSSVWILFIAYIDGRHYRSSLQSGQKKFLEAAKVWKFTATTVKYQKRSERVQLVGSQDECSSCQKQSIKVGVERNWCNCKGILISWKILAVGASLPSSCLKFDPIWARARLQSSTRRHSSSVSEKEEK